MSMRLNIFNQMNQIGHEFLYLFHFEGVAWYKKTDGKLSIPHYWWHQNDNQKWQSENKMMDQGSITS